MSFPNIPKHWTYINFTNDLIAAFKWNGDASVATFIDLFPGAHKFSISNMKLKIIMLNGNMNMTIQVDAGDYLVWDTENQRFRAIPHYVFEAEYDPV